MATAAGTEGSVAAFYRASRPSKRPRAAEGDGPYDAEAALLPTTFGSTQWHAGLGPTAPLPQVQYSQQAGGADARPLVSPTPTAANPNPFQVCLQQELLPAASDHGDNLPTPFAACTTAVFRPSSPPPRAAPAPNPSFRDVTPMPLMSNDIPPANLLDPAQSCTIPQRQQPMGPPAWGLVTAPMLGRGVRTQQAQHGQPGRSSNPPMLGTQAALAPAMLMELAGTGSVPGTTMAHRVQRAPPPRLAHAPLVQGPPPSHLPITGNLETATPAVAFLSHLAPQPAAPLPTFKPQPPLPAIAVKREQPDCQGPLGMEGAGQQGAKGSPTLEFHAGSLDELSIMLGVLENTQSRLGAVEGGCAMLDQALAQVRYSLGKLASVVINLNHNTQATLTAQHCHLQLLWEMQMGGASGARPVGSPREGQAKVQAPAGDSAALQALLLRVLEQQAGQAQLLKEERAHSQALRARLDVLERLLMGAHT